MRGVPSFWVNSAACVDVEANKITHKTAHGELIVTQVSFSMYNSAGCGHISLHHTFIWAYCTQSGGTC